MGRMSGTTLEDKLIRSLWGTGIKVENKHATILDIEEGTDMIVSMGKLKYRIDPTFDMKYKTENSSTELLGQNILFSEGGLDLYVSYGRRTDNGFIGRDGIVKNFSEPVLVIEIKEYLGYFDSYSPKPWAEKAFEKLGPKIVEEGFKRFRERELIAELQNDPLLIGDLTAKEQTRKLQLIAVEYSSPEELEELLDYLYKPSEEVLRQVELKNPELKDRTAEIRGEMKQKKSDDREDIIKTEARKMISKAQATILSTKSSDNKDEPEFE